MKQFSHKSRKAGSAKIAKSTISFHLGSFHAEHFVDSKKWPVEMSVIPVSGPTRSQEKSKKTPKKNSLGSLFSKECKDVLARYDEALNGLLEQEILRKDYRAKARMRIDLDFSLLLSRSSFVRLSGMAEEAMEDPHLSLDEWRRLGGDAMRAASSRKLRSLGIHLDRVPPRRLPAVVQAVCEGLYLSLYRYEGYGEKPEKLTFPHQVHFFLPPGRHGNFEAERRRAKGISTGVCFAREIVNTPAADFPPSGFVKEARRLVRESKGRVQLKIFGEQALRKLGAGAILGVNQGSEVEPFLLHLQWKPKKKTRASKRIVLIGKGVTFDSGGLSIKTRGGMESMKCDMAGGAAVLGLLYALVDGAAPENFPHELHVLIPTVENMVNGRSLKPGDVVRTIRGKTIEVLNIDAEGRLILADALDYSARLNPHLIIDVATLTGACVVSLGTEYAGLFSDDVPLTECLIDAGQGAGENYWQLPLVSEYRDQLKSAVADLKNMGNEGGPGAILAALFLKEFVPEGARWAHVDMAGPAFLAQEKEYSRKGGSGFGVRSLLRLLENMDSVLAFPTKDT